MSTLQVQTSRPKVAAKNHRADFIAKQKAVLLTLADRLNPRRREDTDISQATGDLADISGAVTAADAALALASNTANLLHNVNRALRKIELGTYGICEVTGTPISEERLEAIPWANLCLEAQRDAEEDRCRSSRMRAGGLFEEASADATETDAAEPDED